MRLYGEWYHYVALGALAISATYWAIWAMILEKMDEVEDDD